jgi:hypothetical protein
MVRIHLPLFYLHTANQKIIKPFNFDGPSSILGEARTFLGGGKNNEDSIICEFYSQKTFVIFTN